jgi:nitrite reductase (NO-forming)
MKRITSSFKAATALAFLAVFASSAFAGGSHDHPSENGTAASPLDVVRAPTDLSAPIGIRGPQTIKIGLETVEVTGSLSEGASYHYWTFNKKVPGPFVRARVGDTIEVELTNRADSSEHHSVDFHAVTGPGGGAAATDAAPGESKAFSFKALKPGLYVYHCAVPLAAQHIANGMYGLILVEPEGGLPPVDREFYVMQDVQLPLDWRDFRPGLPIGVAFERTTPGRPDDLGAAGRRRGG